MIITHAQTGNRLWVNFGPALTQFGVEWKAVIYPREVG